MPGWFWDRYTFVSPTRLSFIDFYTLGNSRCADMEIEWLKCADRVGLANSKELCPKSFDDYKECISRLKSENRFQAIREELVRQKRKPIDVADDMKV
ncbi:NADH dehydrogenase [ubiquinone] iron-sulfur protein 5-like [Ruditapes philippinarum]|uniref:NADH dehydrogenase [ubiquinone] iron-sulfur protein 5-like n=1 Tax=Ruditapes philippinarum TaxID=129788 RepID=UPI00295ADB27|nr:NADH dehydrogenase [ubiquinone] iron-sulfur protein 5-like [Ruditapes philippinarum]